MDAAALDRALANAVERGDVPGVVGIVADADGVLWTGAAGVLSTAGDAPMPLDAVFKVASMTKLVTTVATLQQVDDGLLDLDTPVAEIVPLFAELPVLDGFDGDVPRLRPQTGRPTVRQLLSHTSGLGYAAWHPDLNRYHQLTGARELGSARRAAFAEAPLVADPGAEFNYSSGLDWAGLVVEELSGQPLDRYWRRRIFDPLQMDDTLVLLDDAHRAVSVPVHLRGDDGAWDPTEIDLYQPGDPPPEFFAGGHCLYSTAADYTRLQRAILRGGELDGFRVLQPATLEELFRDQLGGIRVPVFPAAQPFATAEVDLGRAVELDGRPVAHARRPRGRPLARERRLARAVQLGVLDRPVPRPDGRLLRADAAVLRAGGDRRAARVRARRLPLTGAPAVEQRGHLGLQELEERRRFGEPRSGPRLEAHRFDSALVVATHWSSMCSRRATISYQLSFSKT